MKRKIITINKEKCDGCGLCAKACHEGAIGIKEGKAVLLREDYCDGLGDCLPVCPVNAISFVEREADAPAQKKSSLRNFPVQMKLVPFNAPYFHNAELLIAADCTAYACPDFHSRLMAGKVMLIGCPKLDGVNYAEKLAQIFTCNEIKSVTVARMQVPCCGGLTFAVQNALKECGREIPCRIVTVTSAGEILE